MATANRTATLERDSYDYKMLNLSVRGGPTGSDHTLSAWRLRMGIEFPRGFIAGAGDAIGFVHDPDEAVVWNFAGHGYQLDHLRPDGTKWTLLRFPPEADASRPYGAIPSGVAGGPNGDLAMLGAYQPFRQYGEPAATVGMIQAFAP